MQLLQAAAQKRQSHKRRRRSVKWQNVEQKPKFTAEWSAISDRSPAGTRASGKSSKTEKLMKLSTAPA